MSRVSSCEKNSLDFFSDHSQRWRLAILELQIVLTEILPSFHFSCDLNEEKYIDTAIAVIITPRRDSRSGRPSLPLKVDRIE